MSIHVIVVGGGIGGLCLAQGLRKAGVSVAVYEKGQRQPPSSWQQGYQIHINASGSAALEECLPPATRELFAAKALRPSAGVQVLTEHLEPIGAMPLGAMPSGVMPPGVMPPGATPPGPIRGSNPIVRSALREVLLAGLDDVVHFHTPFARFERAD